LKDGASFEEQTRGQIFSLNGDEAALARQRHHSQLSWDKKKKKFVKGSGEGADNLKMVKTESGTRLPATYRSGRFEEWQSRNRLRLPRVGEQELPQAKAGSSRFGGRKFHHSKMTAPKALDKQHVNYERKSRQLKKGEEKGASGNSDANPKSHGRPGKSRYGGKPIGRVKNEIKTVDQIRKSRELTTKRKAKNARPSKKKGRR
jgi:ATP-dependent RNA helicase DDX54/DBP10